MQVKSILKDKPSEAGETSAKKSLYRNPLFHIVLVTIIGFLVYSNTFNVPFQFDDNPNIVENYKLKDLSNFWPPSGSRWFGFLTFALNYHFGGLNTVGYHIVNLIIHILNAILVYFLVAITFRTPYFKVSVISASVSNQPDQFNLSTFQPFNYLPFFIALLFVSHPIQTQAVTYIVQRFTSLAAFFCLLSLVMYIKWRLITAQQRNRAAEQQVEKKNYCTSALLLYCSSLLSAILAMKTKEISFTLPFIVVLYEFMFFKGKIKKRVLYLIPLILTMLIIPLSLGIDKPIGDAIGELREAVQETEEIPRWSYLLTQFRVIVTYIRLLFLPIKQNLDYDYPRYNSFLDSNVFLSLLFLFLIFGLGVYLFYRSRISHSEPKAKGLRDSSATPQNDIKIPTRLIAFGIFWFFITLSVESSIIPIRDVINEHRLYLPSVGIIIAFTSSVFYFLQFTIHRSRFTFHASRFSLPAAYSLLTIIVIVFSIATYERNIIWQDGVSLWKDVVRKSPNKARGYNNLGKWGYSKQGLVDKAIQAYHVALRLNPYYILAYNNLGVAYYNKGWIDKAIEYYQFALNLNPDFAEVYDNLGIAYYNKGWIDKAIEYYQFALNLKPTYADAHNNLGVAYVSKGLLDEAIKEYRTALQINPEFKLAMDNLNRILQIQR